MLADRRAKKSHLPRRWGAAAGVLLFGLALAGSGRLDAQDVTVEGSPAPVKVTAAETEENPLLARQPLGYDRSTIERLYRSLVRLPENIPYLLTTLEQAQPDRAAGTGAWTLIVLLVLTIACAPFAQRWLARRLESIAGLESSRVPSSLRPWLSAVAQVMAAGLIPLAVWGLYVAVARTTDYEQRWFVVVGGLLLAWTRYSFLARFIRELVLRPLLPIPPEHGRYLYGVARWLVLYAVVQYAVVDAMWDLGVSDDTVLLVGSIFHLSLIVLLTIFLARKRAVLALFPDVPNRLYRTFVRSLDQFYSLALSLTTAVALLSWAGYRQLANFIFIRSWAVVGLFLGAVLIHQLVQRVLRAWIVGGGPESETALGLLHATGRLLDYLGALAVVLVTFQLVGVHDPLVGLLSRTIYSVGERPVTPLALFESAAIIAAFLLLSRLVRSFLDFRIYPSLRVDEGIGHAINAFILYAMAIVGVTLALQIVGLGLGSLTIFAGALGIGLGFGLQAITNNLASGLILTFSRGLRKGDWVTVGDTIGVINEVGIRATRLRTRDAIEYLVPNSEFVNNTLVNWTFSSPHFRMHVPLGVSYGSDPEKVREILLRVAAETPDVAASPAPEVWCLGFGDSSLDFELLVWVNAKQVGPPQVQSDLYFKMFQAFKENGIEIPFPQRDLHIRSDVRARLPADSEPAARRTG